jgi:hypothetical protein
MNDKTIIFLHISKTAGNTVALILERNFQRSQSYTLNGRRNRQEEMEKLHALTSAELDGYKLIKGHLIYGLHKKMTVPHVYLTFLREPIKRVSSMYSYILNTPLHYLYKRVVRDGKNIMGFEEFLESNIANNDVANSQVRILCSDYGIRCEDNLTGEHLERAKRNLETCSFGITEQFNASLLAIGKELGLQNLYYVNRNVTRKKKTAQISSDAREIVVRYNKLDIELYDHAKTILEQRFKEHGVTNEMLATFAAENARYQNFTRLYYTLADTARDLVNAGVGFYKRSSAAASLLGS